MIKSPSVYLERVYMKCERCVYLSPIPIPSHKDSKIWNIRKMWNKYLVPSIVGKRYPIWNIVNISNLLLTFLLPPLRILLLSLSSRMAFPACRRHAFWGCHTVRYSLSLPLSPFSSSALEVSLDGSSSSHRFLRPQCLVTDGSHPGVRWIPFLEFLWLFLSLSISLFTLYSWTLFTLSMTL